MVREFIKGAYDLHVHSSPDIVPRKKNDIELAREAKDAGMRGILIKNHYVETSSRAALVKEVVNDISVYGGIVLNLSIGGLNPYAVEISLKLGAKEVWMPTVDSLNHRCKSGKKDGLYVLDEKGRLKKEVYEILELIATFNVILGTGHLSTPEIFVLVDEAAKLKVRKILITHPEFWITSISVEKQIELRKKGVFFERCYYSSTLSSDRKVEFNQIIDHINKVGFESTIISTDLGQKGNPNPVEGLKIVVSNLLKAGVAACKIKKMVRDNPRYLIEQ